MGAPVRHGRGGWPVKIKTEYQAMGMYVAWDADADPETAEQGAGRSPEEAIKNLTDLMSDREDGK